MTPVVNPVRVVGNKICTYKAYYYFINNITYFKLKNVLPSFKYSENSPQAGKKCEHFHSKLCFRYSLFDAVIVDSFDIIVNKIKIIFLCDNNKKIFYLIVNSFFPSIL